MFWLNAFIGFAAALSLVFAVLMVIAIRRDYVVMRARESVRYRRGLAVTSDQAHRRPETVSQSRARHATV